MTEKNIFVYKLFLSLNILHFSLIFFVKIATPSPPKKVTSPFPATPLSKLRSFQAPPPFWNFGRRFKSQQISGGSTLCITMYLLNKLDLKVLKEITIMIVISIKISGTSTSLIFGFDIRFMNAESSFKIHSWTYILF